MKTKAEYVMILVILLKNNRKGMQIPNGVKYFAHQPFPSVGHHAYSTMSSLFPNIHDSYHQVAMVCASSFHFMHDLLLIFSKV